MFDLDTSHDAVVLAEGQTVWLHFNVTPATLESFELRFAPNSISLVEERFGFRSEWALVLLLIFGL